MAIKPPTDANGEFIPVKTTTMMYLENGNQFHVTDFFYEVRSDRWFARSGSNCIETNKLFLKIRKKSCLDQLENDSWSKLVNDISRAYFYPKVDDTMCAYVNRARKQNKCEHCRFKNDDRVCEKSVLLDIEFRILRLLDVDISEWPEGKKLLSLYEDIESDGDSE